MRAAAAVYAAVVAGAGPEHPKWRAPRIMAPHATRLPKQLQPLERIRELAGFFWSRFFDYEISGF
jgi:hypothetical protein